MRRLSRSWPNDYSCEGFLFFAQSIQELLFDYSLASCKAPALSLMDKINEAEAVLVKIKNGQINAVHRAPVLEELVQTLMSDVIAKSILGERFDALVSDLRNSNDDSAVRIALTYLGRTIPGAYPVHCIKELRRHVGEGRSKRDIYELAKLLCGAFSHFGYSRQSTYFAVTELLDGADFVGNDELFSRFIKPYDGNSVTFKVYTKVSDAFGMIVNERKDKDFGLLPPNSVPDGISQADIEKFSDVNGRFVDFNISSRDHYSAAEMLSTILSYFESCVTFYVHDRKLSWSKYFYVVDKKSAEGKLVNLARSEMEKILRVNERRASRYARRKFLTAFNKQMPDESADKIISSLVAHSTALKSSRPDTQLVTLWSATETLLPAKERGENIMYYIDKIVPCLMLGYTRKLFEAAFWGYYRSFREELFKILRSCAVEGDSVDKMAACLILPEFGEQYAALQQMAGGHPLARFRAQTLKERFSDPVVSARYIASHKQKLQWQILRIYRARNSITHAGENITYIRPLLSNLHEYYDDVVECFDYYMSSALRQNDVRSVFDMISWDWAHYEEKYMKNPSGQLSASNYKSALGIRKLTAFIHRGKERPGLRAEMLIVRLQARAPSAAARMAA